MYFNDIKETCIWEDKKRLNKILPINEFQSILKRERFLSDRNGHGFSLVTFDKSLFQKNSTARKLTELISRRLRLTDTIGWCSADKISVLLPETDFNGAKIFADKVRKEIDSSDHVSLFDIQTYPSTRWQSGNTPPKYCFKENSAQQDRNLCIDYKIPVWKRSMDFFVSAFGLLLLSPFLILVAILIKIVSPGPVFYKQKRIGLSGKIFDFYKFRTMKANSDERVHEKYLKKLINCTDSDDKPMEKIQNDSRIIPLGNFLRKSCIDELPQLINVLSGEMTLVGPRPCIPYEAEEYLRWHARRFYIVPGMTGLWQISGKNERTFKEMIRLDIEYINKHSFILDIKILLKTPYVILNESFRKSNNSSYSRTSTKTTNAEKPKSKFKFATPFIRLFL